MRSLSMRFASAFFAVMAAFSLMAFVTATPTEAFAGQENARSVLSYDEAVDALVDGLGNHEDVIEVSFVSNESLSDLRDSLLFDVMQEDGNAYHGDYLRHSLKNIQMETGAQVVNGGARLVTVVYRPTYSTTASQEEAFRAKVDEIIVGLDLDGKSKFEKAKAIHDYIIWNVTYGSSMLNDPTGMLQYTGYAALVRGQSVCEGYAIAFYVLAREAGLPARIITGIGNGGAHAWNIVQLDDGYYYNIDATWDENLYSTDYLYFLKSDADFGDHYRYDENQCGWLGEDYTSPAFYAKYPMAVTSYDPGYDLEADSVQDGFSYSIKGGKATITGYVGSDTNIVVPSKVGGWPGYPVEAVGDMALAFNDAVKSVVIPEGVKTIGMSALSGCTSLESVMIPSTVTKIGSSTFRACTSLKSVVIPEGVRTIEMLAFFDCWELESVTIPSSVDTIESNAFSNCRALKEIVLPIALGYIGSSAFYNCSSLKILHVPHGVSDVGSSAFVGLASGSQISCGRELYDEIVGSSRYITTSKTTVVLCDDADEVLAATPRANTGLVYSGAWCVGVNGGVGYLLSGDYYAIDAGAYTAVATLEEGYVWEDGTTAPKYIEWTIAKATYDVSGLSFSDDVVHFDGSSHSLSVKGFLPEGVRVSYQGNSAIEAGTYAVTASFEGDSNFEPIPDMTALLVIEPVSIRECMAALEDEYAYTGQPIEPDVKVFLGDFKLIEGVHYTISFEDNVEPGEAWVYFEGLGSITQSGWVSFMIVASEPDSNPNPTPSNPWENFPDVKAEVENVGGPEFVWYVADGWLDYVVSAGLMGGYSSNGWFGAYDDITRGQVAVILYRAECAKDPSLVAKYGSTTDSSAYAKTCEFEDMLSEVYYTAAVNWAKAAGIMTGDSGTGYTTVRPDDPVARQELCLMLARYANGGVVPETELDADKAASILGMGEVADWASDGVNWAVNNGVISGVNNGDGTSSMKPTETTWRAAAAKMFTVVMRDIL